MHPLAEIFRHLYERNLFKKIRFMSRKSNHFVTVEPTFKNLVFLMNAVEKRQYQRIGALLTTGGMFVEKLSKIETLNLRGKRRDTLIKTGRLGVDDGLSISIYWLEGGEVFKLSFITVDKEWRREIKKLAKQLFHFRRYL